MKQPTLRGVLPLRYVLACIVGLLHASAFPTIGLSWMAWLTPGLLMILCLGQKGSTAFRIGYCAGLTHYLLSLYWLLLIPIPVKAIAAWVAVSAVLALYTGLWTWICSRIFPAANTQANVDNKPKHFLFDFRSSTKILVSATWHQRIGWCLGCASAWVAIEMGIGRLFTGFPWNFLGVSQYKHLALIQIASVTGVYGISFLIVWISISLLLTISIARGSKIRLGARAVDLALPTAVLMFSLGFGWHRVSHQERAERELRLALIQPSIPQPMIWDESEKLNRFQKLVLLSQEAAAAHPDVLVWPEAALPNILTRFNRQVYEAVTNLVIPNHCWMIFGADDAEPKKHPEQSDTPDFFNGAFLVEPTGRLVARYHKRRLVMCGEYMPLAKWFPFLNRLRQVEGGFTPGQAPVPFELANPHANISVLICFEDVFPHLVRGSVSPDTDLLLNLTNNGWFGESAAQWQHAVSALFRAVENGVPLVRCTNNGLTCWVDERGHLHDIYFPGTEDVYGAGFKIVRVPLRKQSNNESRTVYSLFGDWFGWSCVAVTALLLIGPAFQKVVSKRRTG